MPSSERLSSLSSAEHSGRVLCVTGVSGGGKGTVIDEIRRRHPDVAWSVSMTTRAPRAGEQDGVHYHFVDDATFDELVETGGLVEWDHIYGMHRSGTPRGAIDDWLASGSDVLVECNVVGAEFVKRTFGERSLVVFLRPPDAATQRERLELRGTTGEDLERRLAEAIAETEKAAAFADATVVNHDDDIEATVEDVEALFFGGS